MAKKKQATAPTDDGTKKQVGPSLEVVKKVDDGYKLVDRLMVTNQDASTFAQGLLTGWKEQRRRLQLERLDITRDLDSAKRKIMALYQPIDDKLEQICTQIEAKIIAYNRKMRDEAAAAQKAIDDQLEADRQRDLKLADKARARGDDEKAEQFEQRAETRVAPILQVASVAAPGRAFVEHWSFEIVDASKLKREYLEPDEKKIGAIVRSLHKDAEATVGQGAIKVTSNDRVRG